MNETGDSHFLTQTNRRNHLGKIILWHSQIIVRQSSVVASSYEDGCQISNHGHKGFQAPDPKF